MNLYKSDLHDAGKSNSNDKIHVMLVEDSLLIREALLDEFFHSPVAVIDGLASTAGEAISALRRRQFDILVVDIELAQGTGFDVLRNILQQDYPFAHPVCLIFTNHAHSAYRREAKKLGVKYFFDKSMDFEAAMQTIEIEAQHILGDQR